MLVTHFKVLISDDKCWRFTGGTVNVKCPLVMFCVLLAIDREYNIDES
jgi:hypothetical protein